MSDKIPLDLREPEDASAWLDSFKAHCRAEKKRDILADATADPVVEQDLQITDQFLYKCGLETLKKLNSLVAHTNRQIWPS